MSEKIISHQQVDTLLQELEWVLKSVSLWSEQPPAEQAFESNLPFCCDTMYFQEWLQYVFLPRMRGIIVKQLPLPSKMALLPMAEEAFIKHAGIAPLLEVIRRIDTFFSESE
ncbi:YqcC family protein [Paraneptunicella aestuarii]|uniref:YqcC family protein n=1 Tax=Paraneptunicella aestuarii TaxID=2831148 RepID=UPI001E4D2FF5|nr:YqcC family protein [Paraneptunicella aestuarii]UAA39699.1 YqcC family protein [Paraneptunicella aestuarii]